MSRRWSTAPRPLPSAALLAALAFALMLPALLSPPLTHDSFWIDFVWIDQFNAQLRQGVIYPRWLPASHGGLGAPVFYFYAPLAFYGAGLFGLLGLGAYASLLATAGAAWFGSGLAMWLWLRGEGGRALLGAGLYMALPYHVIDFYRRGALAEFCAYAVLPLVAIAVRRAAAGRGYGALATAYAALILVHLPTALLTSVLLLAPWCAWLIRRDRAAARPLATGLLLGLMLASLYLVPALSLQRFILVEQLWSAPLFRASNWNFFVPSAGIDPALIWLFAGMTALLAATATIFALRGDRWALGAIAMCAIVAGIIPALWDMPILAKVQFPWRALLLVEFALATAVARSRLGVGFSLAAAAPVLLVSLQAASAPAPPSQWTLSTLAAQHPEVREYLPSGAPPERNTFSAWALDLARRQPPLVRDNDRTIAALFYFPAWQVRCASGPAEAAPDPATRLLSYRGEGCTLSRSTLPVEWAGGGLSLAALLLLLARGFRSRRDEGVLVTEAWDEKGPGSRSRRALSV